MANQTPQNTRRGPKLFTPPGGGPDKPESEFTKEELLWLRRTTEEWNHRHGLYHCQIIRGYRPSPQAVVNDPDAEMDCEEPGEICNKSVPMYFLWSPSHKVVVNMVDNYIYRH